MDNERNTTESQIKPDPGRQGQNSPGPPGKRTTAALHEMHKTADKILEVLQEK